MTEDLLIAIITMFLFVLMLISTTIIFSRYYKYVREFVMGVERGEVEVLICPKCRYANVIKPRAGDYIGKTAELTCPRDGERLIVYAMYVERPREEMR